jgi:CubicO group peptidase (beta-lactamase class C family)
MNRLNSLAVLLASLCLAPQVLAAAPSGDPSVGPIVDSIVGEWLTATRAPSASIAIVRGDKIVYVQAYGSARLNPNRAATVTTRYPIDSVSKEFTATAVLILTEQGKLSLDDEAAKWFPDLGEAGGVTLRQLLTHTSGIRDYWPQDFVPPEMARPTTTAALIDEWVHRPLDFEPGTDRQYSNSGYVLAGAIVEKVSGQPLIAFLQQHIFSPLKMSRVTQDDTGPLQDPDAEGYTRYGLGQVRPAPKEGAGWLFAAAGLAMQPSDLALWDLSLIERSLLAPQSYAAQFDPVTLKDGSHRDYGLGFEVEEKDGRHRVGHDGAGSGFLAANRIWPDDAAAIVVLTNNDWASPDDLVDRLAFALLPSRPEVTRARAVFAGFQHGMVDRALFTEGGNAFLNAENLADLAASLGPLGPARLITLERETQRGGMITRRWKILCRARRLEAIERGYPGGKLEQFMVSELGD